MNAGGFLAAQKASLWDAELACTTSDGYHVPLHLTCFPDVATWACLYPNQGCARLTAAEQILHRSVARCGPSVGATCTLPVSGTFPQPSVLFFQGCPCHTFPSKRHLSYPKPALAESADAHNCCQPMEGLCHDEY